MSIRSLARRYIRGVSWNNPTISVALKVADPVDNIVRQMNGHRHLPPFSIRVRSIGISQDIGGTRFVQLGRQVTNLLRAHAGLTPDSRVLEIGCGCGTNAFALAEILDDGNYVGMDIERVSLKAARDNLQLRRKSFQFDFLDIQSDAYNPKGLKLAAEYVFPYPNESFDVVFFISVFTHMLTDEVSNYTRQIARILKPGGRCFFTAYLLDRDMTIPFPFSSQEHSYMNEAIPAIAVAYRLAFLSSAFSESGMHCTAGPLWGSIHGGESETGLQDILVFTKPG